MLQPAVSENPIGDAAVELGILRRLQGRRVEAMRTLSLILSRDIAGAAARRLRAGRAGRRARSAASSRPTTSSAKRSPGRPPTSTANIAWGELFLEKYERSEAARSFEAALRGDAQHPAALLGMARTVAEDNPPLARKLAQQTLAVNPNEAGAHVLLAQLALDDVKRADAKAEIDKALAINPNHLEALSLSAALAWLEKRTADQAAATEAVLKINPLYGEVHRVIGGVSARAYRFDEAAEFARKAIGARPRELPGLRRSGRAPDARRRRARRPARARDGVPRRPVRRRHLQPARPARHPRRLRDDSRRRHGDPAASRRGRR